MKYLIGIVGENGAGKDTFTTFFRAAAAPTQVAKLRFSDVLAQTLNTWGIPLTRSNLQNMAIIMDNQYGKGSVTRAAETRIKKQKAEIIIIEGVRWKTDVPMLKNFPNSFLVYITADKKIRYDRLKRRGEKVDEKTKTYDQFLKEEKAGTEVEIPEIGSNADYKIENNGTLDEFRSAVEEFYKTRIKK